MSSLGYGLTFVLGLLLLVDGVVAAGENGTKQIGQKTYKLGVNSTNFKDSDLAALLYTAAFDFCSNKTYEQIVTDLTAKVTQLKGASAIGLLAKLSNFQTCLSNCNSSMDAMLTNMAAGIVANSQTGKICNSYLVKQSNMWGNGYACKKIVNTLFVWTNDAVNHDVVQAGVTAGKKRCTTKEWTCGVTAAKDFANVAAYNT